MPQIVHVVTTRGFAGVERYVTDVARETAARGWDVVVVGGDGTRVPDAAGRQVRWEAGATLLESARSLHRVGTCDIAHAHMTAAEAIAIAARPFHRAPVIATRHFAARRGASLAGRCIAPFIARGITREIAVGQFVADHMEHQPSVVVHSGVASSPCLWRTESRVVLVLQRLELEKDTATALRAWHTSRLAEDGWRLRIVGDGSQRRALESLVAAEAIPSVTFTGPTADVAGELAAAGVLLAPALAEPLGLAVLEAMSAGVPVAASASGGHLETVGAVKDPMLFSPGDVTSAARALRALTSESLRARLSREARRTVAERFTIERHVDRLLAEYDVVRAGRGPRPTAGVARGVA
jgi:glycosyltransferase involved in cell wall biosynthesis